MEITPFQNDADEEDYQAENADLERQIAFQRRRIDELTVVNGDLGLWLILLVVVAVILVALSLAKDDTDTYGMPPEENLPSYEHLRPARRSSSF